MVGAYHKLILRPQVYNTTYKFNKGEKMQNEKTVFTIEYTDFGVTKVNSNGDPIINAKGKYKRVEVVASNYEEAIQSFRDYISKSLKYVINVIYRSESKLIAINQ